MSDLRIRSEAVNEVWAAAFLPPQADAADRLGDAGEGDLAPFVAACSRALAALFGAEVMVLPGRPGDPGAPRVAAVLAGQLAAVRMGGDPARPSPVGGVAQVRYARIIAEALDACAARVWPPGSSAAGFDLDISCGPVSGHAHVPAPALVALAAPLPPAAVLRPGDLPLRLRVELSSDTVAVASLLPLRVGCILPINPRPEMPLIVGDHCIGRATVAPHGSGSQQANIVAIAVDHLGGRA